MAIPLFGSPVSVVQSCSWMAFEEYFRRFAETLHETMKETHEKYPRETEMLFEFIDNWLDLLPKFAEKERFLEATNSLSGIVVINSWKLTNWITYEILTGNYFEAMRDLRFLFEGSVYAVILEDTIERTIFEEWEKLSTLDFKSEIFELWEECRRHRVYTKGRVDEQTVRKLVVEFISEKSHPSKRGELEKYVALYTKILSNQELYLSTSRMLPLCVRSLRLDETNAQRLNRLWHDLSRYQHFSYPYLEALVEDPEFVLLEKVNTELFERSVAFYFETLDFFYSVLVWRFSHLRDPIREICRWWQQNFEKTFSLAEKTLARLED